MVESVNIPRHVAIIMDGNGRWAQKRGKERIHGHIQGVESVRTVLKAARKHGVGFLTLYVFSTENWGRPTQEVQGLMELLCESIVSEMDSLKENAVRVCVIGDREAMSDKVKEHLRLIETETAPYGEITLVLALNYGSREEIINCCRIIAQAVEQGNLKPESIDKKIFESYLYTSGIPDPDLLIRTSGEQRLSNYLLWQSAYTELYFTDVLWPDFGEEEFEKALAVYATRERRYGLLKKTEFTEET